MGTGELTEVPINVPAASPAVVIRPEVPAEIPVGQEGPVPAAMAPEVASESVLVGQSEAGLAAPVVGSVEFNLDNEIAKLNAESFAIDRDADEAASINSLKEKGYSEEQARAIREKLLAKPAEEPAEKTEVEKLEERLQSVSSELEEVKRKFTESELRNEKTVSELKDAVLALALYSKENNSQKKEELWKEVVKALIALGVSAFTEVQEDMSEAVKEVTS